MNMIVPKEIEYILSLQKRKDAKRRILKVYEALLYKKGKKTNYFDCPSNYLSKVNSRYWIVIKLFLDYGIIDFYSKNTEENWGNLFDDNINVIRRKKYYNTENGHCAKYKFLIDITKGIEYDLDIDKSSFYDKERWYQKTRYSLLQLEFNSDEIIIKRDNFSRRVHTNITGNIVGYKSYRKLMSGGDYYAIDSKTSQPRLLWLKLKEVGLQDNNLNYIFDNDLDFYDYILERIPSLNNERDEAKELFASWVNGTGYLEEERVSIRNIFPIANTFIKSFKTSSYKDVCRYLQHKEATIFIDDLLNNIPVEFALTVHDSLLVRKEDADKVLEWCRKQRPELRFEKEEIKEKKI